MRPSGATPFLSTTCLLLCVPAFAQQSRPEPRAEADFARVVSVLESRCFGCHDPGKKTGKKKRKIDLSRFRDLRAAVAADDVWSRMRDQVEKGEMPPEEAEPLSDQQKEILLDWYRATFEAVTEPVPGPSPPRRLTRREYQNSLEELLGIRLQQEIATDGFRFMKPPPTIVEKLLPADPPGGSGFNNDASVLGLNRAALIKCLRIAQYAVDQIDSVKGARERVFAGQTEAAPLLRQFARRAFRRPVSDREIAVHLRVFESSRAAGEPFDRAIKDALIAVLTSSNFLYRIEADSPGAAKMFRVSDFDLAARLSYFLWSTTPDDELLRLAGERRLGKPDILSAQVRRMLRSPKVRELSRNFAGQWLGFQELLAPGTIGRGNNKAVKLRLAMHDEALLYFEYLVKENRSILEVVDSRKTYLNKVLAGLYGGRPAFPDRP